MYLLNKEGKNGSDYLSICPLKDNLALNGHLPFTAIFVDKLGGCSTQVLL